MKPNDRQPPGSSILEPLCASLIIDVHVVVLNLAERPVICVYDLLEDRVPIMEGEAQLTYAPIGPGALGPFEDAKTV